MNAIRLIRDHFKLTQRQVAEAVGFYSVQGVSVIELHPTDRLTVHQIRLIKKFVEERGQVWPDELTKQIIELEAPAEQRKPRKGRPPKVTPEGETA